MWVILQTVRFSRSSLFVYARSLFVFSAISSCVSRSHLFPWLIPSAKLACITVIGELINLYVRLLGLFHGVGTETLADGRKRVGSFSRGQYVGAPKSGQRAR